MLSAQPWPIELRLGNAGGVLRITFDDAAAFELPAELLRVSSPSAEVRGHGPGDRKIVGGKRNVVITEVEAVGNYAVRLRFDDGHDTGLFTWAYLHELGLRGPAIWATYIADLAAHGLSRDEGPAGG